MDRPTLSRLLAPAALLLVCVLASIVAPGCAAAPAAPNAFTELPGHDRYVQVQQQARELRTIGRVSHIRWNDDRTDLWFTLDDVRYRFDLAERTLHEAREDEGEEDETAGNRRRRPPRGRQREREPSPDGRWVALAEDWNVVLHEATDDEKNGDDTDDDGGDEDDHDDSAVVHITTGGQRKHRFGKASWVYGEELRQTTAMWWSPDSTILAYYEFDERDVPDYYLTGGNTDLRTELLVEGYPKAGDPNPIAKLWLYHLESGERVEVDVGEETDQYIYRVRFSPQGDELLFHRTNRRQNVLELMAADVNTGASRVILTETQSTWQDNRPEWRFLEDGERFIWQSERTGWKQYELWHLNGSRLAVLTEGDYPVASIAHICEQRETLFYTAYSDPANALNQHLHRVSFDGRDRARLTDGPLNHTVNISPCGSWFIARSEALNVPATTTLHDRDGHLVSVLAEADPLVLHHAGLTPSELRARARRLKRAHGLSLILIDYIQLMQVGGTVENRATEISEISRSLKGLAKELDVPVVVLSQLNRSLEQRTDKRPVMSDLRESGAIEQDADVIVFIYRDEVYDEDSPQKGTAEILVRKQRNGPTGTVRLTFLGQYTRFENFTPEVYGADQ